jgi:hypothetical protein
VFVLNQGDPYPGWRAVFPTVGSLLVILAGRESRVANLALANTPFVFTGIISYPLYLWHWPLLVFCTSFKFASLTLLERGGVVFCSFVLAWLTYAFVEKPIRFGYLTSKRIVMLGSGMAAAALAGLLIVAANGLESRFPKELQALSRYSVPSAWRHHQCLLDLVGNETIFAESCIEVGRPLLAVWGDSTAAALMPGLRDMQREGLALAQFTASNCGPESNAFTSSACRQNNKAVLAMIEHIRPDLVLLHSSGALNSDTFGGWKETIAALHRAKIRMIVLGPVPAWKRGLAGQMLNYFIKHRSLLPQRSNQLVDNLWDETSAQAFFAGQQVEYISAWNFFCNRDGCLTRLGDAGAMTAIDRHHLSEEASIFLIRSIADKLSGSTGSETIAFPETQHRWVR